MQYPDTLAHIHYRHEILRAKLSIRDHYFRSIIRGIYENTGQMLSLVQIQLAMVESQVQENIKSNILQSRTLVGQVIYDLRYMGSSFFPEEEILSESGLTKALERELESFGQGNSIGKISVRGIPFALATDDGLIFYLVVLEIVTSVVEAYGPESLRMAVSYTDRKVKISISYPGEAIDLQTKPGLDCTTSNEEQLPISGRLELIGGEISVKTSAGRKARIDVSMPYAKGRAA